VITAPRPIRTKRPHGTRHPSRPATAGSVPDKSPIRDRIIWALTRPLIERIRKGSSGGEVLGEIAWHLLAARRRAAIRNVTLCVNTGGLSLHPREVAKQSFRHFGRVLTESLRLADRNPVVRWLGDDPLELLLSEDRPVMVLSGHLGNWEVAAWAIQRRTEQFGKQLNLIVAPPSSKPAAGYTEHLRRRWGVKVHSRESSLRGPIRALLSGDPVGTAVDQFPGHDAVRRGNVLWIPFFGVPTPFDMTLFRVAERTGSAVIAPAPIRTDDGSYDIYTTQVHGVDAEELCRQWVDELQRWVASYPEQYLWMHRRWKETP
jgi:Kdo2-lipid IVA lauroyltransferase/acyltransferase